MSKEHNDLAKLVAEYRRLLETHGDLRVQPDPWSEHGRVLTCDLPPLPEGLGALGFALDWWRDNGPRWTGRTYAEQLHCLLRELDTVYRNRSRVDPVSTPSGTLLLGLPWWLSLRSARSLGGSIVKHGDWVGDMPLLAIRLADGPYVQPIRSIPLEERLHRTRVAETPGLRIGMCVLGQACPTSFEDTGVLDYAARVRGFRGSDVRWDGGDAGSDQLRGCIEWARRERIHVLLFPELSIDEAGRTILRDEIARDPGELALAYPGSFHEHVPNVCTGIDWVNRAPIWVVAAGGSILSVGDFDKWEPFTFRPNRNPVVKNQDPGAASYREHICPGGRLMILETLFGRIGVAICRDVLSRDFVRRAAPWCDHLVILSFSASKNDPFLSTAEDLARTHHVASYYVNSDQLIPESDSLIDLAFVCFPSALGMKQAYRSQENAFVEPKRFMLPHQRRVLTTVAIPSLARGY